MTDAPFPAGVPVRIEEYPADDAEVPAFLTRAGVPGIVDVHVHAMPERLQQAVWRYFGGLTDPPWPIRYRHDLDTRLDAIASFGVVAHTALAYAHQPGMLRWLNDFTLDLADRWGQVVPTFTVYPEDALGSEVEHALERGGAVVKVHDQLSGYRLDDPRMDPAWSQLVDARTLVVAHTSKVYGAPGGDGTTGGEQIFRVKERYPELRLCIAHLGQPDPDGSQWDAITSLDGVWTDVSAALTEPMPFGPTGSADDRDVDAVRERLTDHVLFGSDYPSIAYTFADQVRGLGLLGLDPAGLREVLHDRTARLLADAGWTVTR